MKGPQLNHTGREIEMHSFVGMIMKVKLWFVLSKCHMQTNYMARCKITRKSLHCSITTGQNTNDCSIYVFTELGQLDRMQQSHRCVSRDGGILLANGHDCNRNGLNGGIFLLPTHCFSDLFPSGCHSSCCEKGSHVNYT